MSEGSNALRRAPYVGEGIDGCWRSAEIDRSELDMLPTGPHDPFWTEATEDRRRDLEASVRAWEAQAAELGRAWLALPPADAPRG